MWTVLGVLSLLASLWGLDASWLCAADKAPTPSKAQREQTRVAAAKELAAWTKMVPSSKDGSLQKAVFYAPPEAALDGQGEPAPLLVGLHTWSGGYEQGLGYIAIAKGRKWVMVAPDFRGPNVRPEACASELAVQDVLDAVAYAREHARVDASRIYAMGSSGGGHMALMMAARAPKLWAGVSAWVPISDLAAWHAENVSSKRGYAGMLEKVCGGPPGRPETDAQYRARSPLFILAQTKGLPLDINVGIHDGHSGSVPVSQSLWAFNMLARANGLENLRLTDEQIAFMTSQEKVPPALVNQQEKDPERQKAVLFRRIAGPVRLTVFEGGHDSEPAAALAWLARQRQGSPATHQASPQETSSPALGSSQVAP